MPHQQENQKKLISFIIPVYDVPEEMLRTCIDSIRKLSLRQFEREIIVVDDGSVNNPLNTLNPYLNEIIYIRQKNSGLGSARNRGLQNATGEYIQFVDADDALIINQYEHCLDLARFQHPDMIMFEFSKKNESHRVYTQQPVVSGNHLMRYQNLKAAACSYLFRKAILGNHRFTTGIYHEDEEFTPLLVLRAESIIKTDAEAYYYRTRQNSITTKTDKRNVIKRLSDFKNVIYRLNDMAATMPSIDWIALQRRIHQLTMDYIYNVIVLTHSQHYLDRQLELLQKKGLFPLPDRDYTQKYKWFRRMTSTSMGRTVLLRTLPFLNKER